MSLARFCGSRAQNIRVSEESQLDPEAVAAKWREITPGIDRMMERAGDQNDFRISAGTSLSGDDKASSPYQVSHAARMCIVAGVDHIHAAKSLLLDLGVLHNASPFSLVRGSLENLAAAYWILHPKKRNERIEHALRWHAKNFHEQHLAYEPLGRSDEAKREAKLVKLEAIAKRRGITSYVRGGYRSSDAVKYVKANSTRSDPLLPWQLCSGYAHGRPWAYLGMSEQEHFETTDPDVLNVRLTTDPARLLYPTLAAYRLLIDVMELYKQRS